jgi:importin subunit beta-1
LLPCSQTNHHFIAAVVPHLAPVLLQQLTKQEEGLEQDDTAWNMAMASGTCLGLLARTAEVGRSVCARWRMTTPLAKTQ